MGPLKNGFKRNVRLHSLRKFFRSQVDDAGVALKAASALGGWTNSEIKRELGVGGNLYSWADKNADYLRREYEKALPYLAITRTPVTVKQVEDRAARQINDLKAEISRLEGLIVKSVSFKIGSPGAPGGLVTFEGGYKIKKDDMITRATLGGQGFEEREFPGQPKYFLYSKPASRPSPQARNREGR